MCRCDPIKSGSTSHSFVLNLKPFNIHHWILTTKQVELWSSCFSLSHWVLKLTTKLICIHYIKSNNIEMYKEIVRSSSLPINAGLCYVQIKYVFGTATKSGSFWKNVIIDISEKLLDKWPWEKTETFWLLYFVFSVFIKFYIIDWLGKNKYVQITHMCQDYILFKMYMHISFLYYHCRTVFISKFYLLLCKCFHVHNEI